MKISKENILLIGGATVIAIAVILFKKSSNNGSTVYAPQTEGDVYYNEEGNSTGASTGDTNSYNVTYDIPSTNTLFQKFIPMFGFVGVTAR